MASGDFKVDLAPETRYLNIQMPNYSDAAGGMSSLALQGDPVAAQSVYISSQTACVASTGPLGFFNPEYDTADGAIWDGDWEGHGIIVAASGASADLLGEEFSVTGAFNLDDNGLRYIEIWRGDTARASYYVKTDGRHFEPYYDPPAEDNWIASYTDAITGDDPDDPRVIKMDPATDTDNYAGFFFPGTTDKFAFAHTVTDPNDPGNSYTVCYNMDRV